MRSKGAGKARIIPLGGLGQIGMNITAVEYGTDIIVIDCGVAFPEDDMLGVDLVIPDIAYLRDNKDKVRGLIITHGHEDHIGAIPYVISDLNIPIYATRLTMALIDNKLKERGLENNIERHIVSYGEKLSFGSLEVEYIRTNHSISDSAALAITTPVGVIIHTGDFKVDYTPVTGEPIDLQRFAQYGIEGVLALMCDSTNAERPGFTSSERTVGKAFESIFSDNKGSRIYVATFASNIDRVQQIINAAYRHGRKVIVQGRSMVNAVETASEIGYLDVPDDTLIDIDDVNRYPDEQLVIITTGSQGETMAALNRIVNSKVKKLQIKPGDTVIFSSNPIPGNEKAVSRVINELSMQGANVVYQDAHVSGHACAEEIKLIYSLVKPKYAIPVHGEYRHLKAQASIAKELGMDPEHIFILEAGDVLSLDKDKAKITSKVKTGALFVDGLGIGDIGSIVLHDRQVLAENGMVAVITPIDADSYVRIAPPEIISRGFIYVKESDGIMIEMTEVASEVYDRLFEAGEKDHNKYKAEMKDSIGSLIWQKMKRRPMVLPIFIEI
ncbi:MAG: ribonuclease J [Lachnospiraceae bacterium]|nr:ribonuclease J [Lachnospiraceae bacterium]